MSIMRDILNRIILKFDMLDKYNLYFYMKIVNFRSIDSDVIQLIS